MHVIAPTPKRLARSMPKLHHGTSDPRYSQLLVAPANRPPVYIATFLGKWIGEGTTIEEAAEICRDHRVAEAVSHAWRVFGPRLDRPVSNPPTPEDHMALADFLESGAIRVRLPTWPKALREVAARLSRLH